MTGAQKTVAWVIVGIIGIVLVTNSVPDKGIPEGYKGSYLGRGVQDLQLSGDTTSALGERVGTGQRF
jgi:hypothetical protein